FIPQEPYVLPSTMKMNIDPYCECTDLEIMAALDLVGLKIGDCGIKEFLSRDIIDPDQLTLLLRQQISFVRAILRSPRVLLIDEGVCAMKNNEEVDTHRKLIKIAKKSNTMILTVTHNTELMSIYESTFRLERQK